MQNDHGEHLSQGIPHVAQRLTAHFDHCVACFVHFSGAGGF